MKKIAITGASGYIGRHVVQAVNNHDCNAIRVIHPSRTDIDKDNDIIIDILKAPLEDVIENFKGIDTVIHLAWQSGFNHHDDSHLGNVIEHLNFIEKLIVAGVKNISIAGTMHEIGYYVGEIDSCTPCNPTNPYGIAKNFLRQASIYMANKNNINLKWLRMFYITGDDIHSNSIFSKILKAETEGKEFFPLNSGEMLYDFIDITTLSEQIFKASNQTAVSGIINCCSGKPKSLRSAVESFIDEHNLKIKPKYNVYPAREYDSPAVWGSSRVINEIMK